MKSTWVDSVVESSPVWSPGGGQTLALHVSSQHIETNSLRVPFQVKVCSSAGLLQVLAEMCGSVCLCRAGLKVGHTFRKMSSWHLFLYLAVHKVQIPSQYMLTDSANICSSFVMSFRLCPDRRHWVNVNDTFLSHCGESGYKTVKVQGSMVSVVHSVAATKVTEWKAAVVSLEPLHAASIQRSESRWAADGLSSIDPPAARSSWNPTGLHTSWYHHCTESWRKPGTGRRSSYQIIWFPLTELIDLTIRLVDLF